MTNLADEAGSEKLGNFEPDDVGNRVKFLPLFGWFGQGLTVKDPLFYSEEGDEQKTHDFTQVRATRRLTALRPALIVLSA